MKAYTYLLEIVLLRVVTTPFIFAILHLFSKQLIVKTYFMISKLWAYYETLSTAKRNYASLSEYSRPPEISTPIEYSTPKCIFDSIGPGRKIQSCRAHRQYNTERFLHCTNILTQNRIIQKMRNITLSKLIRERASYAKCRAEKDFRF